MYSSYQFLSLDKQFKLTLDKQLLTQKVTLKYLVSETDRTMNEAFRQLQMKKFNKNYMCPPCQKRFQSSAALQQHIKKSHANEYQPQVEQRKRGRPRRDAVKPSEQLSQWQNQYLKKDQEPEQPKRTSSLKTLYPVLAYSQFKECIKRGEDGLIFKDRLTVNEAIDRVDSMQKFIQIDSIKQTIQQIQQDIDSFVIVVKILFIKYLNKEQSLSVLFTSILINFAQYCNDDLMNIMIIFIKAFYYYTNNFALRDLQNELDRSQFGILQIDKTQVIHDQLPIELFPLMANGFLKFLPNYLTKFDLNFAVVLIKEINQWVHSEAGGYKIRDNI